MTRGRNVTIALAAAAAASWCLPALGRSDAGPAPPPPAASPGPWGELGAARWSVDADGPTTLVEVDLDRVGGEAMRSLARQDRAVARWMSRRGRPRDARRP